MGCNMSKLTGIRYRSAGNPNRAEVRLALRQARFMDQMEDVVEPEVLGIHHAPNPIGAARKDSINKKELKYASPNN